MSGVRWSNVDIITSFPARKKIIGFSAASCLVLLTSQTSVSPHSQRAQTLYHWLCLLAFHCNNHNCYFAFEPGAGNYSSALRSHGDFIIARLLECPGCRGDKISTVPRVLPEKQCGTERVLPERLARPISQACTRIAWQPEASVLDPASSSNNAQEMSCTPGPSRANSRDSHAQKVINKLNLKK